jgi:hypothetical protein
MVKEGVTPPSFCDCTLGWQEAAYSTILGRPVRAELEESILRGGKKCIYRIRVIEAEFREAPFGEVTGVAQSFTP